MRLGPGSTGSKGLLSGLCERALVPEGSRASASFTGKLLSTPFLPHVSDGACGGGQPSLVGLEQHALSTLKGAFIATVHSRSIDGLSMASIQYCLPNRVRSLYAIHCLRSTGQPKEHRRR